MRGMFSKNNWNEELWGKKFKDRKSTFRWQNSKDDIYKMWLCPHEVEGNGNQNCSPKKIRNYEVVLLEESATKMVNF